MASAADEYVVDFSTLWVTADWLTRHCVVPDGFQAGEPFELADWQLWFIVNHYRVRPDATWDPMRPVLGPAFHYRRSQLVMPQKAGKGPLSAAHICVEAVGPALFAGWAAGGEVWDCRDQGCGCGWRHEYQPGEPMGMAWPTPLIQITATSEDQTDNVYGALRPMIDDGPLSELIPKTGEEFIRLPGGGRIDVVTSNARSRLGQRVTFALQDETGLWTPETGMVKVAETQRRGLAGMGGRACETTNAWDPAENSVAQRTAESKATDIFRLHPQAPSGLSYGNKAERRKIHQHVYRGCRWVNLDAIESEAAELIEVDPAQAERFFGNRVRAGQAAAFDPDRWKQLRDTSVIVADRSLVTLGVDGARFDDALAVIGTVVATGFQWVVGIWERPETAGPDYEHPMDDVDAAVIDVFTRMDVWRMYCDPQYIEDLVDRWQGRWGRDRVIVWWMNRFRQVAYAVKNYRTAIGAGDLTHDGNKRFAAHIGNAVRRRVNVYDEDRRPMWVISKDAPMSPRKIDAAAAAVISWEARGDAIASGALDQPVEEPATLIRY